MFLATGIGRENDGFKDLVLFGATVKHMLGIDALIAFSQFGKGRSVRGELEVRDGCRALCGICAVQASSG